MNPDPSDSLVAQRSARPKHTTQWVLRRKLPLNPAYPVKSAVQVRASAGSLNSSGSRDRSGHVLKSGRRKARAGSMPSRGSLTSFL